MKVLHIGNIANNGYNVANLLNKNGIETHVLVGPYFHMAGCPEWEESEFEGDIVDDFFPRWHRVKSTNGYSRPKWVAQGPFDIAITYLIAYNKGDDFDAKYLWGCLKLSQILVCYERTRNLSYRLGGFVLYSGTQRKLIHLGTNLGTILLSPINYFINFLYDLVSRIADTCIVYHRICVAYLKVCVARLRVLASKILHLALSPIRLSVRILKHSSRFSNFYQNLKRNYKKPQGQVYLSISDVDNFQNGMQDDVGQDQAALNDSMVSEDDVGRDQTAWNASIDSEDDIGSESARPYDGMVTEEEIRPYLFMKKEFSELFEHYDLVVGFSTDGIWPLIAGKKYIAYEHGTIRTIPFKDDFQGRMCKWVYQSANAVSII